MKDYPKNPAELRVFVLDSVLTNVTGFTANDNNVDRVINACNKLYAYCGGDEYAPVADDALAKSLEKFSNAMATAMGVAAAEDQAAEDQAAEEDEIINKLKAEHEAWLAQQNEKSSEDDYPRHHMKGKHKFPINCTSEALAEHEALVAQQNEQNEQNENTEE